MDEEDLHDVVVEVEKEGEEKKIRKDDADLVASDCAQSEDDYMLEKRGKTKTSVSHAAKCVIFTSSFMPSSVAR